MNYQQYLHLFEKILKDKTPQPPYNAEAYIEYTRLNYLRMKRWDKHMKLDETLVKKLKDIEQEQHWIIITEPWCGDAAQLVPFLVRLAEQSERITYELQLRDSEPFLIDSYLTNGGKSIPKLIARDDKGNDLFTWGPRPQKAQELMTELKASDADFEAIKIALQKWYNTDKGKALFQELSECLRKADLSA